MRRGVAALGLCSWDRFIVTDHYPGAGEYAIVRDQLEQAGGTTGNTCAALGLLNIKVTIATVVGDDAAGDALVASLVDAGCDTSYVTRRSGERSDSGIIVVSGAAGERDRTIYWMQGAAPRMGDALPVDELLDYQWILLDINDARLRAFFLDLPAHRSPRTKLAGTMTYLAEMDPDAAWQQALRHDVMFGNVRELRLLAGAVSLEDAIERARRDMAASACRVMYISHGAHGALAIRPAGVVSVPAIPVDVADTTGAGDAFAAGCLWGMLDHCDDNDVLRRGTALGSMACRSLGARASLPSRSEAEAVLAPSANTG